MDIVRQNLFNVVCLIGFTLLAAGFETTIWPTLFGSFTSPSLWLILFIYLSLFREWKQTLVLVFVLGTFLAGFSVSPKGFFWLNLIILCSTINFLRRRVFWSSWSYTLYANVVGYVLYSVISVGAALLFTQTEVPYTLLNRIVQLALNLAFCIPVFKFLEWLDRVTRASLIVEAEGGGVSEN